MLQYHADFGIILIPETHLNTCQGNPNSFTFLPEGGG